MKIALLGASGFVGRNVAEILRSTGYSFFPVSRSNGYDLREVSDNFRFLEESRPDLIINCAAHVGSLNYVTQYAGNIVSDNSRLVLNLYDSVKEFNSEISIIQPLANCAYPSNATIYKEDEFWNGPLHPSVKAYGITRRLMLTASECYKAQCGIRTINLITPNMYGPFDSTDPNKAHALNALISKFVKANAESQPMVEIWGTGIAIREWLYAPDFAKLLIQIIGDISDEKFAQPFNIAQESGLSVRELVELILKHVEYSGTVWYNGSMPDGAPRKVMSKTRFKTIFPQFDFTTFQQGIVETADYYKSVYPY